MWFRICVLALAVACAGPAADKNTLTPAARQSNADSFEYVWKTVRDKHWDPKLGGLDWQAVHDELRVKLDQSTTMEEARQIMQSMLERLKETHFHIVPAEAYEELDKPGSREGNPGIDVRILEGQAVVTSVDADSPAAARGVKPGWQIVRVDGKELAPALGRIQESFAKSTLLDLIRTRAVTSRLSGAAGTPVKADFVNGAGKPVALSLDRARPRGIMARLGYLPPMYFWTESRAIRPGIGYVRFDIFFEPEQLMKAVGDALKSCGECRGFIIDVRGNPGGIGALAMGLAGWFMDRQGLQLGNMFLRANTIKFVVFPRPQPFRGPLAILVDGCSASTSEIFAGGLKDLARARIFGTRTAGAALPSVFEKLPNGDGFQYAIANYISQGGKPLEGIGVIPDEEVKLTRQQLLAGQDSVVDAAVSWILKQKN
ncbi:MAG: hypothetical protein LAP87_14885 [Acidobacteriia bacterium]|nr:hypothetical protein [Terriglobia bacterium]